MIAETSRPVRALIVDDEPVSRFWMGSCLASEGISFDEAANADAALRALARQPYDFVLLDLALGEGASGLDVLGAVRARPALESTAVIIVSSSGRDAAVATGLESGADDYLVKPLRPLELRARIAAARRRGRRLGELQRLSSQLASRAEKGELAARTGATSQRAALPTLPFVHGSVRASGGLVPSELMSGDLVDVVPGRDGAATALLVDVAGHGSTAALLASSLVATMREALLSHDRIEDAVFAGDRYLRACRRDLVAAMASVGVVRIEPRARRLLVLNAGLPPIGVFFAGARPRFAHSSARPLGMGGAQARQPLCVELRDDVWVAIASDGATAGELDEDAVGALLARASHAGPLLSDAPPDAIETLLREHLGVMSGQFPADDAALLLVSHRSERCS
jgi:CheY-like chemotaxis protein